MKQSEAERLALNLVNKFGLALKASVTTLANGPEIIIEPSGVHPSEGFAVRMQVGWRSLYLTLIPGKFAAELVMEMGKSTVSNKALFVNITDHIIHEKGILILKINGDVYDPLNTQNWPAEWKSVDLSLKKSPLEINTDDHRLTESVINTWAERFFGCILALSPLEEIEVTINKIGLPEGALQQVMVNRYERSRYNRTLCINFHGYVCKVCNMDFGKTYGDIGEGFIHVHHVVPVSKLTPGYIVNPINDLVPVCPNCHSMFHKKDPPYTLDELKAIMNISTSSHH